MSKLLTQIFELEIQLRLAKLIESIVTIVGMLII